MSAGRGWVASAMVVVVLLAGCGGESESPPVDPEPAIALPAEPVPVEWGPMPLSTVWDAAPGIDLDSRPAQIARAYVDGYLYINGQVGLDEGYPAHRI